MAYYRKRNLRNRRRGNFQTRGRGRRSKTKRIRNIYVSRGGIRL